MIFLLHDVFLRIDGKINLKTVDSTLQDFVCAPFDI